VASTQTSGGVFVGRAEELALVAACAEEAAAGHSRIVWVEGEAGSGKTSLVSQALRSLPAGFRVLRAQADELAVDVPFDVAKRLGQMSADGPFAAAMELLGNWARLQDGGPLAVVVEDLHWADVLSRQALLTAVQRLDQDRVMVMITSRLDVSDGWDRLRFDQQRCQRVALQPLRPGEIAALASRSGFELTQQEAERLHRHTRGHPLYVRTLLAELTLAQLRAPEADLPAPRSLASTTIAGLSALPAEARDLAAAMAVLNQPSGLAAIGRVAGVERPMAGFEALLATGFVAWYAGEAGGSAEFAHPLYRQALYQDLSPVARQRLHRAAAAALPGAAALAHRVAAADGPDDKLADELEATARQEIEARASTIGSRHLLWASLLSSRPEQSEERLVEATWALLARGRSAEAAALRPQVEPCRAFPQRSLVLGMLDWEQGQGASAERRLLEAASGTQADQGGPVAGRAWAELGAIYATQGQAAKAIDASRRALAGAQAGSATERLASIGLALGEGLLEGPLKGLARLHERLPEPADQVAGPDSDLLVTRGMLGYFAGHTVPAIADMRAAIALARQGSVAAQISRCHLQLASLLVITGDWDEALLEARVSQSIVADDHQVWMAGRADALLSTVFAYRGDWEAAAAHLAQAEEAATHNANFETIILARTAHAALARARRQPEKVIELLGPLPDLVPKLSGLFWWPALVGALIDSGQFDRGEESLRELAEAAGTRGLDFGARIAGLEARLDAARGAPESAAAAYERAIPLFGPDDPLLERALTHHGYGQLLAATGDRRNAVAQLRHAHTLLAGAGAKAFLERVDADLAASGIRPSPSGPTSTLSLTEREHDVALLVARGLSNPEVGAQLYISRKAVEYHLANIYGKLGIKSRRELRGHAFTTSPL
jgi:ATP/maltotriose-dependent transcriptional regulator MalT